MDIKVILTADPALLDAMNKLADAINLRKTTGPGNAQGAHYDPALGSVDETMLDALTRRKLEELGNGFEPTEAPEQPTEAPKNKKKKPATDPEPSERKDSTVTLEDIQALSREQAQAGKKEGIKKALAKFEVAKISDLNPIDYLAFHKTITEL